MAKFTRELDELVFNEVITPEVADKIRNYYDKPTENRSLLVIAFGIIGALLIGMGIVLIIAHNWDELSIPVKLTIGLAPLLIAQVAAGFVIIKPIEGQAWKESVAVLLIFAVATAISIVSQVYNIHGSLERFLLVWAVLTLPVLYLMQSRIASLIFWSIIGWYAVQINDRRDMDSYYYWPLALAALPFYLRLINRTPQANSVSFHNWVIAGSLTLVFGFQVTYHLVIPVYITLFSVFMLLGQLPVFADRKLINNAWLIGGSAGTIITLLILTFEWIEVRDWLWPSLILWMALFIAACALLYVVSSKIGVRNILSKSYTFLAFIPLLLIGLSMPWLSRTLVNVLLLVLGVYTIREGAMSNKLWRMNYGLLILSVLIACRFFDTDMSFVMRGLLFVAIGAGFFGMNYYMIRKKKISS